MLLNETLGGEKRMSQSRKIVRNYYRYLFTQGVHGRPNKCLHRHWEIQRYKKNNGDNHEKATTPTTT